jgi:hypothetical protein
MNTVKKREFLVPKVSELRNLDFMASRAEISPEDESEYERIWMKMKADAWFITQVLYPGASIHDGVITINDELMCSLSDYWWSLIDAALAEL